MKNKFLGLMLVALVTMSFTSVNENEVVVKESTVAVVGCGSAGNKVYDSQRSSGYTHREARRTRRAFVRWCRSL